MVGPANILDHATAFAMQTLHGNPISMAAAKAVLETIDDEGLVENANAVGAHFAEGLRKLELRHRLIADVRGRGLALGVELNETVPRAAAQTIYRAFELGAVLYYVGVNSNVLELTPPLILTKAEADEALAILDQALSDVEAGKFDAAKLDAFAGW
jgi:4-aminobutyrate aminotransferase